MPNDSDIDNDCDLIAQYRASAHGVPDAALDRSILGAARAAAWRRRNAWIFISAAAAACAVLAASLAAIERAPAPPPRLDAQTVEDQLQRARARAFLMDAEAMRDSALMQQPGATARPDDLNQP